MRLAIDVMGGDHAPDAILKGCIDALKHLGPDDRLVLFGPRAIIEDYLAERAVADTRIDVEDAPTWIEMDEPPVEAVKSKKDSSIVRMYQAASPRHGAACDAALSAGNTGACVSAATMQMRRLPGVHRPGIAVTIPSLSGPVVLCDAGANPEPRPIHLAQYGIMGAAYANHVHRVQNPRIAQMNIGSEEAKGTSMTKEVRDLLRKAPGANYIGYIEGRDLMNGAADVVVTDGFTGNTLLKLAEGMAAAVFKTIAHELISIDPGLMMKMEPVFKQIFKKHDYHEYGGAPLLGVNGVCIILHGSSEPRTIVSAIRAAREHVKSGVNDAIVARLAEVAPAMEPAAAAALHQERV